MVNAELPSSATTFEAEVRSVTYSAYANAMNAMPDGFPKTWRWERVQNVAVFRAERGPA